jgi:ComF family protein
MRLIKDLAYFLYPPCCEVCGRVLMEGEEILCSGCYLDIPRTNFHIDKDNEVARVFWGRVKIEHATSYFFFNKGSLYQPLLHRLKYQGRGDIGIYMGKIFAAEIMNSEFARADMIVPVPLHPKKQRKRGYNQSMKIAEGMTKILEIPIERNVLIRSTFTDTQTRKSRFDRFLNMQGKFEVVDEERIKGKKILLVDDVVTTGSTLEACATVLLDVGCGGVMVVTVGVA